MYPTRVLHQALMSEGILGQRFEPFVHASKSRSFGMKGEKWQAGEVLSIFRFPARRCEIQKRAYGKRECGVEIFCQHPKTISPW